MLHRIRVLELPARPVLNGNRVPDLLLMSNYSPPFPLMARHLAEADERQLRQQNAEWTVRFVFGRRVCPEPELRAALDAYVEGAPLPAALGGELIQRLRSAPVAQPPLTHSLLPPLPPATPA